MSTDSIDPKELELAKILGAISHPDRIRILEELHDEEKDVGTLQEKLGLPQARASQHLATLRAHRLVTERRVGRHVFYRLMQPDIVAWMLAGLELFEHGG